MTFYPKENVNIVRSIENLAQVYLQEIGTTSEFVGEDVIPIVSEMVDTRLRQIHEAKRETATVNVGDTFIFKTGSWQVREAGIEDKEVIIVGKEFDSWDRLHYVLSTPGIGTFWATDKLVRAIKTNTIDRFVYVGTRCGDDMLILGF